MANLPIHRSPQSERDLLGIWSYIGKDSPRAATAMLRKIDQKVALLADHPFAGEAQSEFGESMRRIVVGPYLVFYEVTAEEVRVMRVFHSAQKWEDLL